MNRLRILIIVWIGMLALRIDAREVTDIVLEDMTSGQDYSQTHDGDKKKLTLKLDDNMNETAVVKKKEPLFNGDVEVEECEKGECKQKKLEDKIKRKLSECTYEGKLESDPESRVAVTNCGDSMNIGLISEKANLPSSTYKLEDGKVLSNELNIIFEEMSMKKDVILTMLANVLEQLINGTAFMGKNNEVNIFKHYSKDTGNDYSSGSSFVVCCKLVKRLCRTQDDGQLKCTATTIRRCGQECDKLKKKVKMNSKINMKNLQKVTFNSKNKDRKSQEDNNHKDKTSNTRKSQKDKKKKGKNSSTRKPQKDNKIKDKTISRKKFKNNKTKDKNSNGKKSMKNNQHEDVSGISTENLKNLEDNKNEDEDDDDNEYEDDIFEDESSSEEEEDVEELTGDDDRTTPVREVLMAEFAKLYKQTEKYQKRKAPENKSQFRSQALTKRCFGDCIPKLENPEKKIYKERTIELGVFADKDLWNTMKEQSSQDQSAEYSMLNMIHSLIVLAETNLLHKSISQKGGFKLVINGVSIWKDDSNPFVKKVQEATDLNKMLGAFNEYAKRVNEPYDGYQKSYDMMILLTGAHKRLNFSPGSDAGLAYVNQVCQVQSTLVLSVTLKKAMHLDNAGALLAHEMGHMLGSQHDGETVNGKLIDCPQNRFIMTPVQSGTLKEWSSCSREQIDTAYDKREENYPNRGNCFFT